MHPRIYWFTCILLSILVASSDSQCVLPLGWIGEWYSYEGNSATFINFENGNNIQRVSHSGSFKSEHDFRCIKKEVIRSSEGDNNFESAIVVLTSAKPTFSCYGCMEVEERTPNILEYRLEACTFSTLESALLACKSFGTRERDVAFRTDWQKVNCKGTIEGIMQFQNEVVDIAPLCDRPDNIITACQKPGSPLTDNYIFQMAFSFCSYTPRLLELFPKTSYEFQCLGTWMSTDADKNQYVYSAIRDSLARDNEHRYRCLLTVNDQQLPNNRKRYSLSLVPSCREIKSDFSGPVKLETVPVVSKEQQKQIKPSCNLPKNFTGSWFTSSAYDSTVNINSTHMHFNTLYSTFESLDTFLTCQETRDSRYLMRKVTQGRCEVEFVCMQFLPRHQNILRFRMGKPYQGNAENKYVDLSAIFTVACQWSAFTTSRDENRNYLYQTLILNPPAPVNCPIGGIYKFNQSGPKEFKYRTRIRGVTERPRVKVICDRPESEWKSCSIDPKTVMLDVDRCATLDHVGRPIGEYDEPDNYLQCAGYWQENQKSYLVTYDTEDPVSIFRCWVYERYGWRSIRMSRALRAACGPLQKPNSSSFIEGASLSIFLEENEREFDDCPQKFYDGQDPYLKDSVVYVLGAASQHYSVVSLTIAMSIVAALLGV